MKFEALHPLAQDLVYEEVSMFLGAKLRDVVSSDKAWFSSLLDSIAEYDNHDNEEIHEATLEKVKELFGQNNFEFGKDQSGSDIAMPKEMVEEEPKDTGTSSSISKADEQEKKAGARPSELVEMQEWYRSIMSKQTQEDGSSLKFKSLDTLQTQEYVEPRWAIPDLIPEGLTILAGRPKRGKSAMVLDIGIAIACENGVALGKYKPETGAVLYCALEASERRIKQRVNGILQDESWPDNFHFVTQIERGFKGLWLISKYLDEQKDCRLVVIDTLQRIRPVTKNNGGNLYGQDYDLLGFIQQLAFHHEVAILIVHHTTKTQSEYFVDNVSGTSGITGAADCIIELTTIAGDDGHYVMNVTGKDLEEKQLSVNRSGFLWEITDDNNRVYISSEREELMNFLGSQPEGMHYYDLATALRRDAKAVNKMLGRLLEEGLVHRVSRGKYSVSKPVETEDDLPF